MSVFFNPHISLKKPQNATKRHLFLLYQKLLRSMWLQSGRVRTYQDIIRGRLRGKKESEREVLPWRNGKDWLRRRDEREKARDRFSMLEGEDTWSGSSDWVENRLGQEWRNARAETEPSGSSIPELRDLFPSLSYSS